MKNEICQDENKGNFNENEKILDDRSASGRKRPWAVHKRNNEYMAYAYDSFKPDKARRLRECATFLVYRYSRRTEQKRLKQANFCRVRLCPICQWRRSEKTYAQMSSILAYLQGQYQYLFLTLTCENCKGAELSSALDKLLEACHRLMKYKQVLKSVKGWFRSLEVTHNVDISSTSYNTYHPHIHMLLAVPLSYFTNEEMYIKHAEWQELWMKAMRSVGLWDRDDVKALIRIEKVRGNTAHAVAECAKYSVKPKGVIVMDDWTLTEDTVRTLDEALHKRRLIAFGGVFKEAHQQLHLDDPDDGDLLDIGDEPEELGEEVIEEVYIWHAGYSQYVLERS